MSSLIQGYNYDIFISYRQKDNKHDGWVTEFVDNLKGELESTFKEEISVYFDINPHDGLLETHDVDESLKEKLKCLIFIPIISRTYCDPKAFAWEHEFKAFVEEASNDEYGLKVKLPNGNVASRVLPIVIYDLDKQDIKQCESVLGGVLRGVEFIYKTAGVNRPLRANEDHPHDNINQTYYRDQVNKVANTIKDVLNSLTAIEPSVEQAIPDQTIVDEKISAERPIKKKPQTTPSVSFLYRLKNLAALNQKVWRRVLLVLVVLAQGFGIFWLGLIIAPSPDRPVFRSDIPLTTYLGYTGRKALALSPDGEYLVYCMNDELNLIKLSSDALSQPISGTGRARSPFFSPDGSWIGFENAYERMIMKVPLTGGNPVHICDLEAGITGGNWYADEIIFAAGRAIFRVSDLGGTPELLYPLTRSDNDPVIWNPQLLPDKKTLLFSQQSGDGGWSIMTWRLGTKESPVAIVERGRDGRYLNSGHIAYTLNNRLYICKLNSRIDRIKSEPQIIATNPIYETAAGNYGRSQFDFSGNGILVYYEQSANNMETLVWADDSGVVTPILKYVDPLHTSISSDAQLIVADVLTEEGDSQIEIIDTKLGISSLFVEDATWPIWSVDYSIIYIASNQVFQKSIDLSMPPILLFKMDSAAIDGLGNLSSDGRYLPFFVNKGTGNDIGYYDLLNDKVEMLDHYNTDKDEIRPAISPDGKWIAYSSTFSGGKAIYVAPFPGPGPITRVSPDRDAGSIWDPAWARDMTALYYSTDRPSIEIWKVEFQTLEKFSPDPPESILNCGRDIFFRRINIHPDGDRFLGVQYGEGRMQEYVFKVIVNWEQELEGD